MSQDDLHPNAPPAKPAAPAGVSARPPTATPRAAISPRRGAGAALAIIIALLALAASGYVGWRQWQQWRDGAANRLPQRVDKLETAQAANANERMALRQRLDEADQVNHTLREDVLGQSERLRHLEDAIARLAEKSQSGHDALLLDEAESLLRMANERYALFHDARGAAIAYAQADQALAAANDGAFSGLRQSLGAERAALEKSVGANPPAALASLSQLRETLAGLPLKPLDQTDDATAPVGAWAHLRHALLGVISVQRDNGTPLAMADARFTRELASLDLAQAQAALLAYDNEAAMAALKRVEQSLTLQFDPRAAAVQQAHAQLTALLVQLKPAAPLQLGAVLTELHNLRAVHGLQPTGQTAPAPAASAAAPGTKP